MSEQRKAVIKNADMSDQMQQDAVDIASKALSEYNIEKDVAAYIKKEFDRKHGPTWYDHIVCLFCNAMPFTDLTQSLNISSDLQACHCRAKFWKLRDTRDEAFYLLLPWPSCDSTL